MQSSTCYLLEIVSVQMQVSWCASFMTSASGVCALLRCKKWRCDKHSSGDVACKHQSFGRCAVSKLAVYSPRPSHTPLSGLRLIVCRLPYEEQLIHTESNWKSREEKVEMIGQQKWLLMKKEEVFLRRSKLKKINIAFSFELRAGPNFQFSFKSDKLWTNALRKENKWQMRKAGCRSGG